MNFNKVKVLFNGFKWDFISIMLSGNLGWAFEVFKWEIIMIDKLHLVKTCLRSY